MVTNKYLGNIGLAELINLIQADFSKKQDWLQFTENNIPDPATMPGKVIQYVGTSTSEFSKGFFYYSAKITEGAAITYKWEGISTSAPIDTGGERPDWADALSGVIYYDKETGSCYIKDDTTPGEWINLTSETDAPYKIVTALPAWAEASDKMIYFIIKDAAAYGYVKNVNETGEWYQFGGAGTAEVPSALTFKGTVASVSALPSPATRQAGDMYVVTNDSTTDVRFVEGANLPITHDSQIAVVNTGITENPVLMYTRLGAVLSLGDIVLHVDAMPDTPDAGDTVLYTGEDTFNYILAVVGTGANPAELGLYEKSGSNYILTTDTSPVNGKAYYTAELVYGKGLIYQYNNSIWNALTSRPSETAQTEPIPEATLTTLVNSEL